MTGRSSGLTRHRVASQNHPASPLAQHRRLRGAPRRFASCYAAVQPALPCAVVRASRSHPVRLPDLARRPLRSVATSMSQAAHESRLTVTRTLEAIFFWRASASRLRASVRGLSLMLLIERVLRFYFGSVSKARFRARITGFRDPPGRILGSLDNTPMITLLCRAQRRLH